MRNVRLRGQHLQRTRDPYTISGLESEPLRTLRLVRPTFRTAARGSPRPPAPPPHWSPPLRPAAAARSSPPPPGTAPRASPGGEGRLCY
eukprot:8512443-Pyramimonas_sp.AAC.1